MTVQTFKTAIGICGLSQAEAAEFLGVSVATVKHWSSGRRAPPAGVWDMLANLHHQIVTLSQNLRDSLDAQDLAAQDMDDMRLAAERYCDQLPEPALRAAVAAAYLAGRLDAQTSDDEDRRSDDRPSI